MPVHVMLHYNMQNAFLLKIPPNAQEKFFFLLPILGISPAIGTLDIAQSHRGQQTQDDDDHGDEDAKKREGGVPPKESPPLPATIFCVFPFPTFSLQGVGNGPTCRKGHPEEKRRRIIVRLTHRHACSSSLLKYHFLILSAV